MTLQFHTLFLFINYQPEFSHIIIPIIPEAGKYSLKMGEHVFWLMLRGSSTNRKQKYEDCQTTSTLFYRITNNTLFLKVWAIDH